MAFAVIQTGGKQYLVKEGDKVKIEKIVGKDGDKVSFDKVLLVSKDDTSADVGTPFLSSPVEGVILRQGKHDKIRVFKKKPKKRYERTQGHRQRFTEVEIKKVA
jgi:large subunit ribosomal protein L21